MSSSLNLSLTDELQDFVNQHSGDGTHYATPSELICDILSHWTNQSLGIQRKGRRISNLYHGALQLWELPKELLSLTDEVKLTEARLARL